MSKTNQVSPQPVYTNYNGPTIQELELILIRIEELDAKREDEPIKSDDSRQAA